MTRSSLLERNRIAVPNKSMVPTSLNSPTINPLHPLCRHIGQSLDFRKERRVSATRTIKSAQRTTEQHELDHERRATLWRA